MGFRQKFEYWLNDFHDLYSSRTLFSRYLKDSHSNPLNLTHTQRSYFSWKSGLNWNNRPITRSMPQIIAPNNEPSSSNPDKAHSLRPIRDNMQKSVKICILRKNHPILAHFLSETVLLALVHTLVSILITQLVFLITRDRTQIISRS